MAESLFTDIINNLGKSKVKVTGSGSKTGKQQIVGAPKGITSDKETINLQGSAEIPITNNVDFLLDGTYNKFRDNIEYKDNQIFLEDAPSNINRKVGIGINKDGEGFGGYAKYDIDNKKPEFFLGYKKTFAGGGLAEEYYGKDKLDWMKNYSDQMTFEEYLRYKRTGSFADGGSTNGSEQAAFRAKVEELMDDGYDFGEAVREAMRQGYKNGGKVNSRKTSQGNSTLAEQKRIKEKFPKVKFNFKEYPKNGIPTSHKNYKQVQSFRRTYQFKTGKKADLSTIQKQMASGSEEGRVLSKDMKRYLQKRYPSIKNYEKFYNDAASDKVGGWKKNLKKFLAVEKIPNIEKAGKFPFGTQAVGGYTEKVKLIKQFNELKPTLKTMGKGTGEKVYTTKPFTLDEWLNAGPERRKIGRMNKEQYLEYRTKMSKSAKAFKKKEKARLSPSEYDQKYLIPKREKELSKARKSSKVAPGRNVLIGQDNLLLGYMSNAAKKQNKIGGPKKFIDILEDGKFVGVRDVAANVNYYYAAYNGKTKIDGVRNKYITDHPDYKGAKLLKAAANRFKYDLPNDTIGSYFNEYKRIPRMGELANFLIRANIKVGDAKDVVERKLNLLSKYSSRAMTANPLHLHHMLSVEANPTKKLQLRLADQNDLAGKVVERYKNKSIDKPTAIRELKNLNVTAALDGKLEGAKENITPKNQVAVAKRRVNQMFNEAIRTRPQLIEDIAKRIDLNKEIRLIKKEARKVGVTLNNFAGVVDFSQAGIEFSPQVQKALDKVLKFGATTLRGLGKGAIVLDPMFAAYDFATAIDKGASGKDAGIYAGQRFFEGLANLPDLAASGIKYGSDFLQGKRGDDLKFEQGVLYEPWDFAQRNLEEKLEAMPKSQKLRNIANRDFDVGIGAGMRMVDDMEIPASRDEIEKERQQYLKSQLGPYYKYGIETLPRKVAKPNKYDIDT